MRILIVGILAATLSSIALACDECRDLETGTQQIGVWGGYSHDSPTLLGTAEDFRMGLAAIRWGVVFANWGGTSFEYVADAMPVVAVFQPSVIPLSRNGSVGVRLQGRTVTGYGFAPIGFKITAARFGRWQPFFETTGGMIRTRTPVPYDIAEATRWNFMFDFGGGLQIMSDTAKAFRFGYKWHHISNANRTGTNPGLDAHLVFAGVSFHR
jgi:opacity protein-like surface antigen